MKFKKEMEKVNGKLVENFYIDDKLVSEEIFYKLSEDYVVEASYEHDCVCEEMCPRCSMIYEVVEYIRMAETDQEAFEILRDFINEAEEVSTDETTINTYRNVADLLNQLADSIEEQIESEEYEEED